MCLGTAQIPVGAVWLTYAVTAAWVQLSCCPLGLGGAVNISSDEVILCAGTFPLQSERMYAALKGHGCVTRLVLLPHESHGYRAHESVMHVLSEAEAWLQAHCPSEQNVFE